MKKIFSGMIPLFIFILSCPAFVYSENAADYIANGNSFANKKQYAKAIEQYRKAAEADPKNNKPNLLISLCYTQSGDLDQGLSYALLASKNDPSYASFYNLGLIHSLRKESEKALAAFDQAQTLNPKSFEVGYQKGLVYSRLKKYDEAVPVFQKALELNPSADKVRLALFDAFLNQGDTNSALIQIGEFRKMKKNAIAQALEARMKEPRPAS